MIGRDHSYALVDQARRERSSRQPVILASLPNPSQTQPPSPSQALPQQAPLRPGSAGTLRASGKLRECKAWARDSAARRKAPRPLRTRCYCCSRHLGCRGTPLRASRVFRHKSDTLDLVPWATRGRSPRLVRSSTGGFPTVRGPTSTSTGAVRLCDISVSGG